MSLAKRFISDLYSVDLMSSAGAQSDTIQNFERLPPVRWRPSYPKFLRSRDRPVLMHGLPFATK